MPSKPDASWFRRLCEQRDWSIRELARRCEIDNATMSRLLSGKQPPRIVHAEAIAAVLNVSVGEVLQRLGVNLGSRSEPPMPVTNEMRSQAESLAADLLESKDKASTVWAAALRAFMNMKRAEQAKLLGAELALQVQRRASRR